ncbi:ThuA domain-containing protein [Parapedobacter tibetensis]|uniref:ThuA domain-containing protein n=1 Tax=Parapedobacter tibetensis TaxID=2972951 RepID=UPI00214DE64F|nr:ThuA domain-containing protein [Parapedobacter tibetensis]
MKKVAKLLTGLALVLSIVGIALGQTKPIQVLMVGGGGSHDFDRWYRQEDTKTLESTGDFQVQYTDRPDSIAIYLKQADILILSNNQPIDEKGQAAITKFVEKGNGLLLLHAAVWYNWEDWPAYNLNYVGGGSKSHEKFQAFKNYVVNPSHPITQGVPQKFEFQDELYRHVPDSQAKGIEVLAIGQSKETDAVYPVVFTVKHRKARIVGITLGHDEHSHQHEAYKALLINAAKWVAN